MSGDKEKLKMVRVEFTYEDGSQNGVEGDEVPKWETAMRMAFENDFIHGAEAQKLIKAVKFYNRPAARKLSREAATAQEQRTND